MITYDGKELRVYALVLGGGSGTRMAGTGVPKQYIMLKDRPVIMHSVRCFLRCERVDRVIIVCPKDHIGETEEMVRKYSGGSGKVSVTAGGSDRNGSLMNGLAAVKKANEKEAVPDEAVILTHDAARPFVTERIIEENIDAAAEYGACATVIPATDTLMKSDDGDFISDMPKRSLMYQAQTPQSFRYSVLNGALSGMTAEELSVFTDACGILNGRNIPIRLVKGETTNIKLTYPQDMYTAEGILGISR